VIGLILIWFFVSNTLVYNYSCSRLPFVSGPERRMPPQLGRVSARTKVPVTAIVTQAVPSSLFLLAVFNPTLGTDNTQKAYWLFQAGVTAIWWLSMVLLFSDIFLVKRAFPDKSDEVRAAHLYLLYASGVIGVLASPSARSSHSRALGHHASAPAPGGDGWPCAAGVSPDGYRDLHDQRAHAP
jgi:amino acid transporter